MWAILSALFLAAFVISGSPAPTGSIWLGQSITLIELRHSRS